VPIRDSLSFGVLGMFLMNALFFQQDGLRVEDPDFSPSSFLLMGVFFRGLTRSGLVRKPLS